MAKQKNFTVNFTTTQGMTAQASKSFSPPVSFVEVKTAAHKECDKNPEIYTFTIISPDGATQSFFYSGLEIK